MKVVEAFLLLLGYEQKDLQMLNEPNWRKMRALLDDALFERIRLHNPRNLDNKTVDAEKIGSMVDDVQFEDLKDRNAILAEMLGFVHDSVALTKQAKKEAEEAAEQKRLEAVSLYFVFFSLVCLRAKIALFQALLPTFSKDIFTSIY